MDTQGPPTAKPAQHSESRSDLVSQELSQVMFSESSWSSSWNSS